MSETKDTLSEALAKTTDSLLSIASIAILPLFGVYVFSDVIEQFATQLEHPNWNDIPNWDAKDFVTGSFEVAGGALAVSVAIDLLVFGISSWWNRKP